MNLDLSRILGAVCTALLLGVAGQEYRVQTAGASATEHVGSQCAHVVEAMAADRAKLDASKRKAWCRARTAMREAARCGWQEPSREEWDEMCAPREEARESGPQQLAGVR